VLKAGGIDAVVNNAGLNRDGLLFKKSGGVIVSTSSLSRQGNVGQTNYSAAKAGVVAMTRTRAMELSRYDIRAVVVSPGLTATEMALSMPDEARARLTASIPVRRMGKPAEVGHAVRFVLENDFILGRIVDIDGGPRL